MHKEVTIYNNFNIFLNIIICINCMKYYFYSLIIYTTWLKKKMMVQLTI
jgi:hypothetical protein